MKTSWDVTIWVGDDVTLSHVVTGGTHTITISGDETGRVALQFLDGLDGLVAFRDEISRVVGAWVPPVPEEDLPSLAQHAIQPPTSCDTCWDGYRPGYVDFTKCSACGKTWPF